MSWWERFWFSPVRNRGVGILRIVLCAYLFGTLSERFLIMHWAFETPREFFVPGLALRYLPLPFPMGDEQAEYFKIAMRLLGACCVLGILTRPSLILFCIGYWYLAAVDSGWGWHDHGPSLVAQVTAVLAVAPGVRAFSVDSVFLNRQGTLWQRFGGTAMVPAWGLRLILVLVAFFYLTAGVSKLRYGGIRWMDGETLSFYLSGGSLSSTLQQYGTADEVPPEHLWKDGYGLQHYLYGARPSNLAKEISRNRLLCMLFSVGTIVLEIGFPLVLLGGVAQTILLLSGAAFHASIIFFMGISFMPWLLLELALVDWEDLLRRIAKKSASP